MSHGTNKSQQIREISGIDSSTLQNWTKRGWVANSKLKKYNIDQVAHILIINMLRSALPLERICGLLEYINGHLDDESDDLIDDTQLYFLFVRLASYHRQMQNTAGREDYLNQILADYAEPQDGAKERVEKVLRIMLTAWAASQLRQAAERMVTQLYDKGEMYHGK